MYKVFGLLFATVFLFNAYPQAPEVSFYGYVNLAAIFDSRQTTAAREGHFLLYPKPKALDANGKDLNAQANSQLSIIQTRAGVKYTGTQFFGAKTTAVLEAEFMGNSEADINGLRVRHAYINLDWSRQSLLLGQTWGMLTSPEMIPGVAGSNGGAPIKAFGRHPQIRFSQNFDNVKLMLAVQSQRDYTSTGPNNASTEYLRNAVLPELHAQLQLKSNALFAGIGGAYKILKPALKTSTGYFADETVPGYAYIAYAKYNAEDWNIKAEGLYGANLHELTMASGYAVSSVNPVTKEESFTPLRLYSVWTELVYGKSPEFGLFIGMYKNLGSDVATTGKFYARNQDTDHIYRIAPRVLIGDGKVKVYFEVEHTIAAYGTNDKYGKVQDTYSVSNTRGLISTFYYF